MEIVWRLGQVSASDIHAALDDAPSYSAVRALLAILVEKGHLQFRQDGKRYLYAATAKREKAGAGALKRLLNTFFDNSPASLVATLLNQKDCRLSPEEAERIRQLIENHIET